MMNSRLAVTNHAAKKTDSTVVCRASYRLNPGFFFLIFMLISLISLAVQNFSPPKRIMDGFLIPDVVGLSNLIDIVESGNYDIPYMVGNSYALGVVFLYRLAWLVHPGLSFCINLALIYLCIRITHHIFTRISGAGNLACIGVICNPYLYLAVTGPNKEIPMLCTTLLVVYLLMFKPPFWYFFSLLSALVTYFFRDGYGVILGGTVILFSICGNFPRYFLLVGLLLCSATAGSFWVLADYFDFLARNKAMFEYAIEGGMTGTSMLGFPLLASFNPALQVIAFYIKSVYNLVALAIYPQFVSVNGGWYILGLAYWVFGILITTSIGSCLRRVLRKYRYSVNQNILDKISVLVIFIWFAVSLSAFTQPRYLMPLLPLAFGIYITSGYSKMRKIILLFSVVCFTLLVIGYYYIIGQPLAPSETVDTRPSFLRAEE